MDFVSSTRAENRTRWKGIVANSSVVPRRPSKVMGEQNLPVSLNATRIYISLELTSEYIHVYTVNRLN